MRDIPSTLAQILVTQGAADEFLENRRQLISRIVLQARASGIDADHVRVNRNMRLYVDWYAGRVSTGLLIRRTGVRRIPPEVTPQKAGETGR